MAELFDSSMLGYTTSGIPRHGTNTHWSQISSNGHDISQPGLPERRDPLGK